NSLTKIINIHHADLRIIDENSNEMKYTGLHAWKREFSDTQKFSSTIHYIENEEIDTGEQIAYSNSTTLQELQDLELISSITEIESLRVCNVILHYHEQSKVLEVLVLKLQELLK
ncbi:MAG: hypothetical protein LAT82_05735, partial [Nanoarchaeota archaeon]|nr:hypothetical protein [Nanoarchaeota archaeon]